MMENLPSGIDRISTPVFTSIDKLPKTVIDVMIIAIKRAVDVQTENGGWIDEVLIGGDPELGQLDWEITGYASTRTADFVVTSPDGDIDYGSEELAYDTYTMEQLQNELARRDGR